ncbi:unannotated protein [freshwater metagenome]|jgi:hypothetical protein|uniref:Unannotated protein n=1 Tax=freshwater metagenome TaxID=449393 RepID=A0A6J7KSS5_9ZZZZ
MSIAMQLTQAGHDCDAVSARLDLGAALTQTCWKRQFARDEFS